MAVSCRNGMSSFQPHRDRRLLYSRVSLSSPEDPTGLTRETLWGPGIPSSSGGDWNRKDPPYVSVGW